MSVRTKGWLLVSMQKALLAGLVLMPSGSGWSVADPVRLAGIGARVVGVLAIVWGVAVLGRNATVHPEPGAHATLRRSGPYSVVRHPIYSGVLVIAATIVVGSSSLAAVGVYAALVALLVFKARFEETLLLRSFSDYAEYAAVTPRFIPSWRQGRRRSRPS